MQTTPMAVKTKHGKKAQKKTKKPTISLKNALNTRISQVRDARGLSQKDKVFILTFLQTGDATKAMRETARIAGTGLTDASARQLGHEQVNDPKIQRAIVNALEEAGLSDEVLASKIADGANAYDVGTLVKYQQEHPDFLARFKHIELALKIKGHIGPEARGGPMSVAYKSFLDE